MEAVLHRLSTKSLVVAIAVLFALALMPTNLKAICILLSSSLIFINWIVGERKINKRVFLFFAVFFVAIALTIFYSDNKVYGINKLTTMASLLVFPVIFSLIPDSATTIICKKRHLFFWIFICSVFLMNVVPFIWFKLTLYGWDNMIEHFPTLLTTNIGKWSIHPIYASILICIAIIFSLFLWLEKPNPIKLTLLVVINLVLISFLLLYSKKGPLFALAVVFSLFIIFQKRKQFFLPSIFILFSLIILIVIIPRTRERFSELVAIENVKSAKQTSTNIRYSIYETTLNLINENKLLGYGIGDYNDTLHNQFQKEGAQALLGKKYNAHNQYLSLMLSGGVIILFVFLTVLGINLVYAIRFDNQLLILLIVFYGIIMFTENILERESGVIYFAFLISFFALFNKEKKTLN